MAGKEESSLKLCPADKEDNQDIKAEQERSLKLLPTEGMTMEAVIGNEKGADHCSEGVDEIEEQAISDTKVAAATQKVEADKTMGEEEKAFPETKGVVPDATVEADEEIPYPLPYSDEDELEWSDYTDDDDVIFSEAEYQLAMDKISAKHDRCMERLLARTKSVVFGDVSPADSDDSDDEEDCAVHDHAKILAAL